MYHLRDTEERKQYSNQNVGDSSTSTGSFGIERSFPFQHVNVPTTQIPTICQCCLSSKDLRSIIKPYMFHGKNEVYSTMLATCFIPGLASDDGLICSDCVRRLRASLAFRQCVESAKNYLQSHDVTSQKAPESLKVKQNYEYDPPSQCEKPPKVIKKVTSVTKTSKKIQKDPPKRSVHKESSDESDAYSMSNGDEFSDYVLPEEAKIINTAPPPLPPPEIQIPEKKELAMDTMLEDNQETESSSEEEDFEFFGATTETPQNIFSRTEFDVGEQRTLPYVLDNTDRTCEICHREFSFFGELLKHMPEHYPNHICDICGKICATRKSLVFHAKTHTDVRLDCSMCDKSFKNKSNLNAHVKVQHKGEKILFKCSQCGEFLNTYNARIKHLAEKHGREDKAYKCMQCPCKYRLGSHLRAHVRRVHLQEKNHREPREAGSEYFLSHICDVCGKICPHRKSLLAHARTHSSIRMNCKHCEKSFKSKAKLLEHVKVHHRGEKLYFKCQECGEMLNTYNSRKIHMAKNHGCEDKAYKCEQCSCKYRLGSHLRAHIRRVHLQEKNHKCQECNRSFFTRYSLETHAKKHTGERNFRCGTCNKTYYRKQSLKEHLKTHQE